METNPYPFISGRKKYEPNIQNRTMLKIFQRHYSVSQIRSEIKDALKYCEDKRGHDAKTN